MLRWLGRAPEEFLAGPVVDVGATSLPTAGSDQRLRWDLPELHAELDAARRAQQMTWGEVAAEIGCTPSRLSNLRTAKQADLALVMRVTQWLGRPARAFVHPADW